MLLATYRDVGYNIVLFLHILTVIVAMAGAVGHPLLFALEQKRPDGDVITLAQRIELPSKIYAISYAVTGLIGFGLVTMGDLEWSEAWLWISILLWVASNGLLHGAMLPAERAVARGDVSALDKVNKVGPILSIMILVVIFLMAVKPGSFLTA